MKKNKIFTIIAIVVVLALVVSIVIIKNNKNNSTEVSSNSSNNSNNKKFLTAEDVVKKLKEKNSNVGTYVVYNEENDPNHLLGRPNQYTSKVIFEDTRLKQTSPITDENENDDFINYGPNGGTIEVFNNSTDMQNRKDYVSALSSSSSFFAEYEYSNNYILLRLKPDLTPTQASEYENIFNSILE